MLMEPAPEYRDIFQGTKVVCIFMHRCEGEKKIKDVIERNIYIYIKYIYYIYIVIRITN